MSEESKPLTQDADAIEAKAIEEANADTLVDILERLERIEAHLSEEGVNEMARAIEQRIVSRLKYGRDPKIEVSPLTGEVHRFIEDREEVSE